MSTIVGQGPQAIIVVWAAFTICFAILYLLPSDPAEIIASAGLLNSGGEVTPDDLARLRGQLGLDRPVIIQYFSMLGGFLTGNWGQSYQTGQPVMSLIMDAFPKTASIAILALLVGALVGCVIAIAAAYTRIRWLRSLIEAIPSVGASLPIFWIGLMLMQIFAFDLRWFPPLGSDGVASMVLPVVALSVNVAAMVGQILGRGLEDAMSQQFAQVATAKGVGRLRLLLVHLFRTAALPSLTIVGILVGHLLAGAIVTETVFAREGFGRLAFDAVSTQDIPLVLGLVVFSAVIFVTVTFVIDLLYSLIDPRLRDRIRARSTGTARFRTRDSYEEAGQ